MFFKYQHYNDDRMQAYIYLGPSIFLKPMSLQQPHQLLRILRWFINCANILIITLKRFNKISSYDIDQNFNKWNWYIISCRFELKFVCSIKVQRVSEWVILKALLDIMSRRFGLAFICVWAIKVQRVREWDWRLYSISLSYRFELTFVCTPWMNYGVASLRTYICVCVWAIKVHRVREWDWRLFLIIMWWHVELTSV